MKSCKVSNVGVSIVWQYFHLLQSRIGLTKGVAHCALIVGLTR